MKGLKMNINSLPNMNPEIYARKYAAENNISIETAREQLKAKYGDPSNQTLFQTNSSNSFADVLLANISTKIEEADDEVFDYAYRFNVSLDEAKEALKKD